MIELFCPVCTTQLVTTSLNSSKLKQYNPNWGEKGRRRRVSNAQNRVCYTICTIVLCILNMPWAANALSTASIKLAEQQQTAKFGKKLNKILPQIIIVNLIPL